MWWKNFAKLSRNVPLTVYGFFLGFVLFRHWLGIVLCGVIMLCLSMGFTNGRSEERSMHRQTADVLEAMAGAVSSGLSVPRALDMACGQIREMYAGMGIDKVQAVEVLYEAKRKTDTSCHKSFVRLGRELGSMEILAFANGLEIMEARGGNVALLCIETCDRIRRRCDLHEQVETLRTDMDLSRKLLFAAVPIVLILLDFIAPDFMAPLNRGPGVLVSCVAFVSIVVAWIWAEKICQIK